MLHIDTQIIDSVLRHFITPAFLFFPSKTYCWTKLFFPSFLKHEYLQAGNGFFIRTCICLSVHIKARSPLARIPRKNICGAQTPVFSKPMELRDWPPLCPEFARSQRTGWSWEKRVWYNRSQSLTVIQNIVAAFYFHGSQYNCVCAKIELSIHVKSVLVNIWNIWAA